MPAHVHTPYTSPSNPHKFEQADEYAINDHGDLILVTSRCGQVAAFPRGHWTRVEIVRSRGTDGRFVKRS